MKRKNNIEHSITTKISSNQLRLDARYPCYDILSLHFVTVYDTNLCFHVDYVHDVSREIRLINFIECDTLY